MLKRKEDTHIFILLTIILVVIAVLLYLSTLNSITNQSTLSPTSIPKDPPTQKYSSDFLHYSISYSPKYTIEVKDNDIVLTDKSAFINISRIATSYNNVDDYMDYLQLVNKYDVGEKTNLKINGYDSRQVNVGYPISNRQSERTYFIYVDGWVYTLSTSSPELYSDLDQIAKSFRYIP